MSHRMWPPTVVLAGRTAPAFAHRDRVRRSMPSARAASPVPMSWCFAASVMGARVPHSCRDSPSCRDCPTCPVRRDRSTVVDIAARAAVAAITGSERWNDEHETRASG